MFRYRVYWTLATTFIIIAYALIFLEVWVVFTNQNMHGVFLALTLLVVALVSFLVGKLSFRGLHDLLHTVNQIEIR